MRKNKKQRKTIHCPDHGMEKGTLMMRVLLLIPVLFLCFIATAGAESPNIVKIGSDVTVEEGTQVNNVLAIGGQVTVDGFVEKNIIAIGGSVVLSAKAVVGGNIYVLGGITVRGRGSEVYGNITELNADDISGAIANALSEEWEGWSWIFAIVSISIFLGVLLLTILTVFLIPKPIRLISSAIREKPFKVTVWGLGGLVLVVPLALLLAVSVVGIVLIPLEMTIVLCAVLLGFIAVSQLVGRKLFAVLKRQNQSLMRETVWGLIVLWLIGWIPYVGWMIKMCSIVLGLGGVLLTRFGTNQHV